MTKNEDPLALVRESRIRMSHEHGNDPRRLITTLRDEERKFVRQIERYKLSRARVAESKTAYESGTNE